MSTGQIQPIRVMIVDDSALMRKLLSQAISRDSGIQVVDTAMDGQFALDHLTKVRPDVILMDVDMPRLDGLGALDRIVQEYALPVVMCSARTTAGAEATVQALSRGAVDFVEKPTLEALTSGAATAAITGKIRGAAQARVRVPRPKPSQSSAAPASGVHSQLQVPALPKEFSSRSTLDNISRLARQMEPELIAIGTSTGGPPALELVLTQLPANFPLGIVIVQHMPPGFTHLLATHLDRSTQITVREATDGERITPGVALIAPGDSHMRIVRRGIDLVAALDCRTDPVSGHRPSVDVLFESVANTCRSHAAAVIMTGMGSDGANGIGKMHAAGAITIAQSPDSCICHGMPKSSIDRGYARAIVPLDDIAASILASVEVAVAS